MVLSNNPDMIEWKPNKKGKYSTNSAYNFHFSAHLERTWSIQAEGKIKFFLWLLIQNKLWMADRLRALDWPHNDKCLFCDQTIESARHLFLKCPYEKEVWFVFSQENERATQAAEAATVKKWWLKLTRGSRNNEYIKREVTVATYIIWNIWVERNRRTFEGKKRTPSELKGQIKEGVDEFERAFAR